MAMRALCSGGSVERRNMSSIRWVTMNPPKMLMNEMKAAPAARVWREQVNLVCLTTWLLNTRRGDLHRST